MKVAYTISGIGHAAVLLWSVLSFAGKPLPAPPSRGAAGRHRDGVRVLADHRRRPQTPPRPRRRSRWSKRSPRRSRSRTRPPRSLKRKRSPRRAKPAPPGRSRQAAPSRSRRSKKAAEKPKPDPIAEALAEGRGEEARAEEGRGQAPDAAAQAGPAGAQVRCQPSRGAAQQARPTRLAAAGELLNSTASLGLSTGNAAQIVAERARRVARAAWRNSGIPPAGARIRQELWCWSGSSSSPTARWPARRWCSPPVAARCSWPPATARYARCSAASLSRCSSPRTTSSGKTSRSTFDPREMIRG